MHALVVALTHGPSREQALMELSKKRESIDDLALLLWYATGVMACLLHEIVAIYPNLAPPTLTSQASNRVCNALALRKLEELSGLRLWNPYIVSSTLTMLSSLTILSALSSYIPLLILDL